MWLEKRFIVHFIKCKAFDWTLTSCLHVRKELQHNFQNERKPENRWTQIQNQAIKKQVGIQLVIILTSLITFINIPGIWTDDVTHFSCRALQKRANILRRKSCCSIVTHDLTWMSVRGSTTCWRAPSVFTPKQVITNLRTFPQDMNSWIWLFLVLSPGRISVPIDLEELDSFDPFAVPTIR